MDSPVREEEDEDEEEERESLENSGKLITRRPGRNVKFRNFQLAKPRPMDGR
jgi:hypothetical protein